MKKDRNCAGYPVYGGTMPVSGVNMPMPLPIGMPSYTTSFNDLDNINSRINSLEQRVNKLEGIVNSNYSSSSYNSSSYNSSNYQMM